MQTITPKIWEEFKPWICFNYQKTLHVLPNFCTFLREKNATKNLVKPRFVLKHVQQLLPALTSQSFWKNCLSLPGGGYTRNMHRNAILITRFTIASKNWMKFLCITLQFDVIGIGLAKAGKNSPQETGKKTRMGPIRSLPPSSHKHSSISENSRGKKYLSMKICPNYSQFSHISENWWKTSHKAFFGKEAISGRPD